mmetsp:Transcript_46412/g.148822  ORF Transcript_46412/g.148822 Transcript_46412/m.148822 type:complete len:200 (-) Transcript_46412:1935-2534(-)
MRGSGEERHRRPRGAGAGAGGRRRGWGEYSHRAVDVLSSCDPQECLLPRGHPPVRVRSRLCRAHPLLPHRPRLPQGVWGARGRGDFRRPRRHLRREGVRCPPRAGDAPRAVLPGAAGRARVSLHPRGTRGAHVPVARELLGSWHRVGRHGPPRHAGAGDEGAGAVWRQDHWGGIRRHGVRHGPLGGRGRDCTQRGGGPI